MHAQNPPADSCRLSRVVGWYVDVESSEDAFLEFPGFGRAADSGSVWERLLYVLVVVYSG
jgi:hypothetical protein